MLATLTAGSGEPSDQDFLQRHPHQRPPVRGRAGGLLVSEERDEATFDWSLLVPLVVHPIKVTIIEALLWIGEPLSPSDVSKLSGDPRKYSLSVVAYHMRELAKLGVVKVARRRKVRGSEEKFFYFVR